MVRLFCLTDAFVFRNSDASQLGSKSSSAFQISQTTARAVRQRYQASVYILVPHVTRLRLRFAASKGRCTDGIPTQQGMHGGNTQVLWF